MKAEGRERARFPRLLLLLAPLASLLPHTIEELFFSGIIGNIKIDAVIPYILQMEGGGVGEAGGPDEQTLGPSPPPSPPTTESLITPLAVVPSALLATLPASVASSLPS